MAKSYLVQWVFLLRGVQRYGAKWQANMAAGLNEEQLQCVSNVLSTIAECLVAFGVRSKQ